MIYNIYEYSKVLQTNGLHTEENIRDNYSISNVTYNSKEASEGTLFICKGAHFKEDYLKDAQSRGAVCYISEKKYDVDMDYIIVSDIRRTMAYIFNMFFDYAWKKLCLIGITGTKGKSTTAYFIKFILDEYLKSEGKKRSAYITSINTYDGTDEFESHITTPEAGELHKHFFNAANSDIEYLTMEVSSQALKYDRVFGVNFDIGVYLNIGEDHISAIEHPDFEDYFASKLRIRIPRSA